MPSDAERWRFLSDQQLTVPSAGVRSKKVARAGFGAQSDPRLKNATAPLSHHLPETRALTSQGSRFYLMLCQSLIKSGRRDLNPRPPEPHSA
jgi:hypothetical protein